MTDDALSRLSPLVEAIRGVDAELAAQASRAVNLSLTLRNWLIGAHIAEFELKGRARAGYGEGLLAALAEALSAAGVTGCSRRQLYRHVAFHRLAPEIVVTLSPQFRGLLPTRAPSLEAATVPDAEIVVTPSPQSPGRFGVPADELVQRLAYSHIECLVDLDDAARRAFYTAECIRAGWSVRELRRQIASLYFERTALSRDKAGVTALADEAAEAAPARLDVRDPYVFEFLGLKAREVMSESQLEDALLDKLQHVLLELGHGFCFEARQRRILIGDTHGFVDLVFYHRILKCHVLIELKLAAFSHENIGQLNTYVTWYKRHVMAPDDNPPVGLLLCAEKDHALAEYALAGLDNQLFVSKYMLHLPDAEVLRREVERALGDAGGGR